MQFNPLVTIGIASYNNAKFIVETLNSIRDQTYPNIEFLIVDDSSTDSSIEVIKEWINLNFVKCKLIINSQNLGITKVANILLNNASGKYFSILGSDDIYLPDKIESQVRLFESVDENVALIFSDYYLINEYGNNIEKVDLIEEKPFLKNLDLTNTFNLLANYNFISAPTVLGRTSCFRQVGGYNEAIQIEDYYMWIELSKKFNILYQEKKTAKYRIHTSSLWNAKRIDMHISLLEIFVKNLGFQPVPDKALKKNIQNEVEMLYSKVPGLKYKKWVFYNFKINKSINSFILLSSCLLGIRFETLRKLKAKLF